MSDMEKPPVAKPKRTPEEKAKIKQAKEKIRLRRAQEEAEAILAKGERKPYAFSKEARTDVLRVVNEKLEQLPDLKRKVSKITFGKGSINLSKLNEAKEDIKWIRIIVYDEDYVNCDVILPGKAGKNIGIGLLDALEYIDGIVGFL